MARDRNRLDHMVPAERLLRSVMLAIDGMGHSVLLDEAKGKLVEAQALVGDHVDANPFPEPASGAVEGQANASTDTPVMQQTDREFVRKRRLGVV